MTQSDQHCLIRAEMVSPTPHGGTGQAHGARGADCGAQAGEEEMTLDDDYYDTCDRLEAEHEAKMAAFVSDFRHKLRNGSWAANQWLNEMHEDLDGDPLWTIVEKYRDDPAKLGPELIALLEDRLHEMAKEEV